MAGNSYKYIILPEPTTTNRNTPNNNGPTFTSSSPLYFKLINK